MFSLYSIREKTMMICSEFYIKLVHLCSIFWLKTARVCKSIRFLVTSFYRFILLRVNSFAIHVFYLFFLSAFGFVILKAIKPRTSFTPRNIDLFFTSASFVTLSSMSTVEMEVFSNTQLVLLAILMFISGKGFTSMLGLHLRTSILKNHSKREEDTKPPSENNNNVIVVFEDQIELGVLSRPDSKASQVIDLENPGLIESLDLEQLRFSSMRLLGFMVLAYLLVVQILGISMVSVYFWVIPTARDILKNKGLNITTFSIFTTISTFASCGFIPTNENMMVFRKNSGLLMILIPQVLLGNTLFPSALRLCIWIVGKLLKLNACMKMEINYLLQNTCEIGYRHLLPPIHSSFLVITVLGFILVQFVFFCFMEWSSDSLRGLGSYEKTVGVLFQCVNSRHAGESIVNLSSIASAIMVLFLLMMYLPPYTSFLPVQEKKEMGRMAKKRKLFKRGKIMDDIMFSQLSYLVIFIILICITEREKMKQDPLNFSIFNIVVEVISAYGNVGFSMGYSCQRQLMPMEGCEDKWYGFAGKWSDEGRIILIIIMFFGRLKKFHMNGGKAWKLY